MCELLGMSANVPTDLCFSVTGFLRRGGATGPHRDGWGIAFYEDDGYREFRDPHPSIESPIARLICDYPIKSRIVISHIRQANVGAVNLGNTHPFSRELWGRHWSYAHNGQLDQSFAATLPLGLYHPTGTTDSEHAFCWLLDQIRQAFPVPPEQPRQLWDLIHQCCEQLRQMGVFNMLLSDAQYLYGFCTTKLVHITRRAPFGEARLMDMDMTIDFSGCTSEHDVVTVIATQPLTTNEQWMPFEPGELVIFQEGEVMGRRRSMEADAI